MQDHPEQDTQPNAEPDTTPDEQVLGDGDMLNVLESVESQIAAIRKAHAEQRLAMEVLEGERQAVREQQALIDNDRETVQGERTRLEELAEELERQREEASGSAEALAERERELEERDRRAREAMDSVEQLEREVQERASRLEEAETLAARVNELNDELALRAQVIEENARRIGELESALREAPSAGDLDEARGRVETLGRELEGARDQLRDAQETGEQRVAAEREHAERLREQLQEIEARGEVDGQAVAAARAQIDELRSELERVQAGEGELRAALELAQSAEREARLDTERVQAEGVELREQVERLDQEIESWRARAMQAEAGAGEQSDAVRAHAEGLERELGEARARVEELTGELARAREAASNAGDDAALAAAQGEADRLRGEIESLREQLRGRPASGGAAVSDEVGALRRDRLKRARALMRSESDKLRRAADAVRQRFEQSEQVLAKRAELAGAYRDFVEMRERTTKREVRSSASLASAALMLVVVLLGGASWFAAGQVMPGQHAAVITLQASGGSREPTQAELEAWQVYHETLLEEPSFLGTVADRMKRRGIASLSSPAQLRTALKDGLTFDSPGAGTLRLELVGMGEARTLRVLDTYATAVASVSNATRTRRADGLSTVLPGEAQVLAGSLDMTRVYASAGIFGGCLLVFFLLVGVLWQRMRKSKAEFERNHSIEAVIDEMGWVDEPERKAA